MSKEKRIRRLTLEDMLTQEEWIEKVKEMSEDYIREHTQYPSKEAWLLNIELSQAAGRWRREQTQENQEKYNDIAQKLLDTGYDLYKEIDIQDQLPDQILRKLSAFKGAFRSED